MGSDRMRRREFITLLGGAAAAWPLEARAQRAQRMYHIGVMMPLVESDSETQVRIAALRESLQKLGWTEGHNLRFDYRWAVSDPERARTVAKELVALTPDVILPSTTQMLAAVQAETHSIPIVFVNVSDPIGTGLVASLARPGGNVTGFTNFEYATGGKWLEILKEIAPAVTRVALIANLKNPNTALYMRTIEPAAPGLGLHLSVAGVNDVAEIERAIEASAREEKGGLLVMPDPLPVAHRELIVALAARHRLPVAYPYRYFVTIGGLFSYGIDSTDLYRRAASYVDRILKGANPGDLPIQQPTKFELAINLKTAKALGLTVPLTLQASADEVIE
jgi:putative tryptophan/tyrosine transport system substrate-binding protein